MAEHYSDSRRRRNTTRRHAIAAMILIPAAAIGGCVAVKQLSGNGFSLLPESDTDTDAGSDAGTDAEDAQNTDESTSQESELGRKVEEKLGQMTLEQKAAQLFVVRPEALTGVGQVIAAGDATREALEKMPVGGIVYFAANLQDADQTRTMLQTTQQYAHDIEGMPLFLAVDEEGGTVSRVGGNSGFDIPNVGDMCDVGATGDTNKAYEVAQTIAGYLTDLGFNLDFAPDADIANTSSTTMQQRSFGSSASVVAPMVSAQVKGFLDGKILCAAKHFPGIGGAEGDSHDSMIYTQKTLAEMEDEELVPFESAISAGVPFVMVGHLSCPQVTGTDDPASVSSDIITGILREQIGYDRIAITDSMGMGAITDSIADDQAAVRAIRAGADMVLMPNDLSAAYQGLLDAVQNGTITEDRFNESVMRILRVKLGCMADDGSITDGYAVSSETSGTGN